MKLAHQYSKSRRKIQQEITVGPPFFCACTKLFRSSCMHFETMQNISTLTADYTVRPGIVLYPFEELCPVLSMFSMTLIKNVQIFELCTVFWPGNICRICFYWKKSVIYSESSVLCTKRQAFSRSICRKRSLHFSKNDTQLHFLYIFLVIFILRTLILL